jgi:hypothetical protein
MNTLVITLVKKKNNGAARDVSLVGEYWPTMHKVLGSSLSTKTTKNLKNKTKHC